MIFDTGTNRIILPLDYYLDLKNKIEDSGSKGHKQSNCYEIIYQNENSIQFSLKINGYIYTLPLKLTYTDYTRLKVRYFFYSTQIFLTLFMIKEEDWLAHLAKLVRTSQTS